jgi:hypothetical protein
MILPPIGLPKVADMNSCRMVISARASKEARLLEKAVRTPEIRTRIHARPVAFLTIFPQIIPLRAILR